MTDDPETAREYAERLAQIRAAMTGPMHSSDHADRYDEDGLPWRDGGHFHLTDIELVLKD